MHDTLTLTPPTESTHELPEEVLERFRDRAGDLDRTNSYFDEDLRELRDLGYLAAVVPTELGGWGLDLAQMSSSQRRLARHAPATALAVTMHSYWIGIAVELERIGDTSLRWVLEAAAAGELFAAGHAETGNDIPVLLSTARAERVEGGYRLTGRKQFGSNGPAWTWLGAHAMVADAPGGPQVVHAFVERTSPGVSVVETWDTLGMRGTASHDLVLDDVIVPADKIAGRRPYGELGVPLTAAALHFAPIGAATYFGIAAGARDTAVAAVVGAARGPRPMADLPRVHRQVGLMDAELRGAWWALLGSIDEMGDGYGATADVLATLMLAKRHVLTAAIEVVNLAMDVVGGRSYFRSSPLERAYRDVRAGTFHPLPPEATLTYAGKVALGDPGTTE